MMQPRKPIRLFTGLVGLPPEPDVAKPAQAALTGMVISEENLRQEFGVEKTKSKPRIPNSYRQLLNLGPQDIIDFFDVKVGEHSEFVQADFVVPQSMLEHRVRRLQMLIARSKEVIEGMASRIIKVRRGQDDPLLKDKAAREKYKRDENARIARSNAKLFKYRAAIRSGNYHERIWQWVVKPVYFHDVVDDCMVFATVIDVRWEEMEKRFTGGLQTHTRIELLEFLHYAPHINLEMYRLVMSLGEAALAELGETETEQKETWQAIKRWEDAVIRAAVHHGIITPRRDLAELLGLGGILDENDDPIEADTTEDALAIKTGGACYGGRIKSEGYRYSDGKIVARALSSFDKPLRSLNGNGSAGHEDAGSGSLFDVNDDTESYDPR